MPADFAVDLCGYRGANPNTSDANDEGSIELGRLMFGHIGVADDAPVAAGKVDRLMTSRLIADLRARLTTGLDVRENGALADYEQYAHLSALKRLSRRKPDSDVARSVTKLARFGRAHLDESSIGRFDALVDELMSALAADDDRRRVLVEQLGEESLLALDIAGSRSGVDAAGIPRLIFGLSLKWSLRTDRAQDCRSQGAKMASLRRGPMPHFAAVTMEPRPAMLALLGRGSGDLDCVYHLHLPALAEAVEDYYRANTRARARPRDTFRRLVEQRRLRDYDDLVAYVGGL